MSKYCTNCGQQLSDDSLYCTACGVKQEEFFNNVTPPVTDLKPRNNQNVFLKKDILHIVKHGLVALLSLIMLIFSFLPTASYELKFENKNCEVKFSALDNAIFMFSSFSSLTEEEIVDSELHYKNSIIFEQLSEELSYDDVDDAKIETLINKYVKNNLMLLYMHEDYEISFEIIANGIISIAYILTAITTFIFALIKLLLVLGVLKNDKIKNISIKFAMFTFILCLATTISNILTINVLESTPTIGNGSTTIIIFSIIIFLSIVAINLILKENNGYINIPLRILSVAISLTILLLSTSPVLTTTVRSVFAGSEQKREIDINIYDEVYQDLSIKRENKEQIYDIIYMDKDAKREYFGYLFNYYSNLTTREVLEGNANSYTLNLTTLFLKVEVDEPIRILLSIYPYVMLATILFACILLYQNLSFVILGKNVHIIFTLSKIITLIAVVVALAFNVMLSITLNSITEIYLPNLSYSLGASTIVSAIIALIAIIIPYRTTKEKLLKN